MSRRPAAKHETAVFAGGCFWGVQTIFQRIKGVTATTAGYSGGAADTATYDQVSSERTGHAESVKVVFDPAKISYGTLLRIFFSVVHDPTQFNRQGPDVGTSYRSAIFFTSPEQQKIANAYIAQLDAAHVFPQARSSRGRSAQGLLRRRRLSPGLRREEPEQPLHSDLRRTQDGRPQSSSSPSSFRTTNTNKPGDRRRPLLRDFALGFIRRIVDLGLEAFEQSLQKGVRIGPFILQFVGMRNMPRQVGQHDPPRKRILPGPAANADMLPLLGNPDPKNLEGGLIALRCRRNTQNFFSTHLHPCSTSLRNDWL